MRVPVYPNYRTVLSRFAQIFPDDKRQPCEFRDHLGVQPESGNSIKDSDSPRMQCWADAVIIEIPKSVVPKSQTSSRRLPVFPIIWCLIRVLTSKFISFKGTCVTTCLGMNLNERELVQHVEFETDTYYASFSAEFEISCSPLWRLLLHCTDSCGKYAATFYSDSYI